MQTASEASRTSERQSAVAETVAALASVGPVSVANRLESRLEVFVPADRHLLKARNVYIEGGYALDDSRDALAIEALEVSVPRN